MVIYSPSLALLYPAHTTLLSAVQRYDHSFLYRNVSNRHSSIISAPEVLYILKYTFYFSFKDMTCIIWDLNKLTYVRQLRGHVSAISTISINNITVSSGLCCFFLLNHSIVRKEFKWKVANNPQFLFSG